MGVKVTIGGHVFPAADYTVADSSTPLAADDTTGEVGSITIVCSPPDRDKVSPPGWELLKKFGGEYFQGNAVSVTDTDRGYITGTVNSVRRDDSGAYTFTCVSRLGVLNVYNVQAQPFVGTLADAFAYYLSLANVSTGFDVDDSIADREVVFPGFFGELWYYLKQMCVSQGAEISLVNDEIVLRPLRTKTLPAGREISRGTERGVATLAQSVEVYKYNNREIEDELVYPPGGWTPEVKVLNVNAGEEAEYTLELSASVSEIRLPEMVENVPPSWNSTSVFTVVADDGLPVSPAAWTANGGRVEITISDDTTHLDVKLRGATGIPTSEGVAATNFALALASDTSGNQYSTLRIVGTGVAFNKQVVKFRTGVTPQQAPTEVGVTIDNPFLSTTDDVYSAGTRAASRFSGPVSTLSATVLTSRTPNGTDDAYGVVSGARLYDPLSHRHYRVRTSSIGREDIAVTTEDDLTWGDMVAKFGDLTYAEMKALRGEMTYAQDKVAGLYRG